ncbi:MAG TPA: lipid-A-disaccharide synthase [Rhodanobacteraceae bacterium]
MASAAAAPVFAMVAGEDSGDQLGADLIEALRSRFPQARFVGVGGPRMRAVGFDAWHDIAELSVMGLSEVLRHLPRLLRLRSGLGRRLTQLRPDVFIGIDAPDFNLGLEARLKRAGIRTAHYVSPSIWAWREGRATKIGHAADCVLCLFPMEPEIYAQHDVNARFVGHPLADRFPLEPDRDAARRELGLPSDAPVLALLPGSRLAEIRRLCTRFVQATERVESELPNLKVIIPAANPRCRAEIERSLARQNHTPAVTLLDGEAHRALVAADVVLLASGTATLEAMLAKRAMVVGYRIAPASYALVKSLGLLHTDTFALPNILAGKRLVPELMQRNCTADRLAAAVLEWFRHPERRAELAQEFERMHLALHMGGGAAAGAARAIEQLLPRTPTVSAPAGHSGDAA